MGNPSPSFQASTRTRGANQALIVVFERDEALAELLLSQLRAEGYEGRSARTPVEVFDLIARYPIRLTLVNLGQAATSRREFWVALDAQRFGRGVQVITYRYLLPGVEADMSDGGGRADVEVRGPQGVTALVEAVRAKLPPPVGPSPDSSFLVESRGSRGPAVRGQSVSGPQQGIPPIPPSGNPAEYAARQQSIGGVLNLSRGILPGQQPEFMPLSGGAPVSPMNPAGGGWSPQMQRALSMPQGSPMPGALPRNGAAEPRAPQWVSGSAESAAVPAEATGPGWQDAMPRPAMPGNSQFNGVPYSPNPSMPMGDLAALSDAINALAAAGAPGYQQVAAVNAMNTPAGAMNAPANAPGRPEERQSAVAEGRMEQVEQMSHGGQPPGRGAAETLYIGQQAFAEPGRMHEAQPQDLRSRSLASNGDEYEYQRRERKVTMQGVSDEPTVASSRRLAGDRESGAGGRSTPYQHQTLAPVVAPGQIERSLTNVLVEGQLVSPQRLEVALGIQRLLRGVDIDYRLGEVLLLFKFLTRDQLLAALLVSRGLVTPAQIASMGRIKQELHAIGMEYDLENLLILFRMLTSEQLREIRSELP